MSRPRLRTPELQSKVVESTLTLLESTKEGLTARSVAAAASTSTAAIYELFGDKAGLLQAVFFEGFRMLQAVLSAVPRTDDPKEDLLALLEAVRTFALARPALFELMFARPFAEFRPGPEDYLAADAVYKLVMRFVDEAVAAGAIAGDRKDLALALITTNRGLITAEIAGLLGSTEASIRRRRDMTLRALMQGLA